MCLNEATARLVSINEGIFYFRQAQCSLWYALILIDVDASDRLLL